MQFELEDLLDTSQCLVPDIPENFARRFVLIAGAVQSLCRQSGCWKADCSKRSILENVIVRYYTRASLRDLHIPSNCKYSRRARITYVLIITRQLPLKVFTSRVPMSSSIAALL